jgi:2,3-diaminopropionate biosynthesis protein SbnB
VRPLALLGANVVSDIVEGDRSSIVRIVRNTYEAFGHGEILNPHSSFLRLAGKVHDPAARIIALPASLFGDLNVAGIKWISSFPDNIASGIPRASALIVLNSLETGLPFAVLEGSIISAARTAASAALGAELLNPSRTADRIGIVGTGAIARALMEFLLDVGWSFTEIILFDRDRRYAEAFGADVGAMYRDARTPRIAVVHTVGALVRQCDMIAFATTAGTPYLDDPAWFARNPVVLNISLRDLAPRIILSASNLVDDRDQCLRADTSPHLAEQAVGHRRFVNASIPELICHGGASAFGFTKSNMAIISPFGMGMLDVAVGYFVYKKAVDCGTASAIDHFFPS